jgi:hypothetical protein
MIMAAADRIANKIHRALIRHWEEFDADVSRLSSVASIQPKDGYAVFQYVDSVDNSANFELSPIVVNVPERATEVVSDLFVVVKGRLSIDRAHFEADGKLRTLSFATQAAYFRVKGNVLSHVYGAHYDFAANESGHPVFHGQMRSYLEFAEVIKSQYGLEGVELKDVVSGILKTVRLPSAQMDVFSFLLQLVADHLLSGDSSEDDKMRFHELLERSKFIQGLGSQIARLQVAPANVCYRAVHWYPPHA